MKIFLIIFMLYAFNHLVACLWIFIGREHSQFIEPYGVGDGWWDAVSWVALGLPVLLYLLFIWQRRPN